MISTLFWVLVIVLIRLNPILFDSAFVSIAVFAIPGFVIGKMTKSNRQVRKLFEFSKDERKKLFSRLSLFSIPFIVLMGLVWFIPWPPGKFRIVAIFLHAVFVIVQISLNHYATVEEQE